MSLRRLVGSFLLAFLVVARAAAADTPVQTYTVVGWDAFRIVGRKLHTEISYAGTERLTTRRAGASTVFTARVSYDRTEGSTTTHASGSFTSTLLPDGEMRDGRNEDPDYLTVLNQPFTVQLDRATMRDLATLRGGVPFDFPSPMTGAPLHGSLRRLPDGLLYGRPVLGIAFSAHGPIHGSLPDRPGMGLDGTITMKGTAYYADANALLLALDATLKIDGKVVDDAEHDPVTIIYRRTIRPAP